MAWRRICVNGSGSSRWLACNGVFSWTIIIASIRRRPEWYYTTLNNNRNKHLNTHTYTHTPGGNVLHTDVQPNGSVTISINIIINYYCVLYIFDKRITISIPCYNRIIIIYYNMSVFFFALCFPSSLLHTRSSTGLGRNSLQMARSATNPPRFRRTPTV